MLVGFCLGELWVTLVPRQWNACISQESLIGFRVLGPRV